MPGVTAAPRSASPRCPVAAQWRSRSRSPSGFDASASSAGPLTANSRETPTAEETDVAYGIVLKFDGVTEDQYWAVNDKLGIERDDWSSGWPDGALAHTGGPTADGGWIVTEVWESKGHQ